MTDTAPLSYADALHALKMEHDRDMNAAYREYQLVPHTPHHHARYMEECKGITNRFKRDAARLATEYGKDAS